MATVASSVSAATWRIAFSTRPFERIASASSSEGCRLTSCTLRTVVVSTCGPTTTAVCVLTRARSWLVSWSSSSITWWADWKRVKKSETTRRCAGASPGWRSKLSTKKR